MNFYEICSEIGTASKNIKRDAWREGEFLVFKQGSLEVLDSTKIMSYEDFIANDWRVIDE